MKKSNFATYPLLGLCLLMAASSPAFAKKGKHHHGGVHYGYENQVTTFKRGKVLDVQTVYHRVNHNRRHQECWLEPRNQYHQQHYGGKRRGKGADILVGSIIGGVIGNQFGSGDGKKVATVTGAAIGGAIANEYSQDYHYQTRGHHGKNVVKVCDYDHGHHYGGRIKGYNVTYKFKGDVYHTFTREHPGRYIKLQVNIVPLG